jgi:DNA polymerase
MGDGLVFQWRPGWATPEPLLKHIEDGGMTVAHSAAFERTIWRMMRRKYPECARWPELPIRQQICTQARAAAHGLPQDLDMLGEVLQTKQRKDREGHALMMKLCRPRKRNADGTYTWWDDPVLLDREGQYCEQDVRTEIELDVMLPQLSAHERRIWELDQEINDRGVYVDEQAITRAVDVVLLAKKRLDKRMKELTGGAVKKCSEVGNLVTWINSYGIEVESAKKGNHDEIMALADITVMPWIRTAIELRKEASKTSTAKYSKMLDCICADGRIRGLLNYHGAGPGRWAGRLVQPQNFPRVDPDVDGPMVEYTANLLGAEFPIEEIHDLIELAGYEPLPALSKTLRGMICAA